MLLLLFGYFFSCLFTMPSDKWHRGTQLNWIGCDNWKYCVWSRSGTCRTPFQCTAFSSARCTVHATMMRMIAMQRAKWMNGKCERVNLMWRTVARKNASGIFIQWQSCGWQTDCHCLTHFAILRTHSFHSTIYCVELLFVFLLVCCSEPRNRNTVWPTIKWFFCYMNRNNFATI